MAQEKQIKTRVALKHDIEANWITAGNNGFCPLAGEVIIYDIDNNYSYLRYKIGRYADSQQTQLININDLEFESNIVISDTAPINPNIGMLWLDTTNAPEHLDLTYIEGVTF